MNLFYNAIAGVTVVCILCLVGTWGILSLERSIQSPINTIDTPTSLSRIQIPSIPGIYIIKDEEAHKWLLAISYNGIDIEHHPDCVMCK